MKRLDIFVGALILIAAVGLAYLGGVLVAERVERTTTAALTEEFETGHFNWATVRASGLQVSVSGAAPNEGSRIRALLAVKKVVNADRIVDNIRIADPDDLHPPRFSLELLRNGDGISLIGLIPESTGRQNVLDTLSGLDSQAEVTDMLETAAYSEPEGWTTALTYALEALRSLPRSKISVSPEKVTITAITDSQTEKQGIETDLRSRAPDGLTVALNISAPRPVITPFSLRFILDEHGPRFDSCSADTEAARTLILNAVKTTGLDGATCRIGLGVPTPRWGEAVATSIAAIAELGGGTLTFSDADVTFVANTRVDADRFDQVIHSLESNLPDVFSLQAVLPPKPSIDGSTAIAPPQFVATKSPEGLVDMRGRLRDARTLQAVANFAAAKFGREDLTNTTRVDNGMPEGWAIKVLAGLDALAMLHHGMITVEEDTLSIRGTADRSEVTTEITQLLSTRIGGISPFSIDVTYDEALNRVVEGPTPDECVARINAILGEEQIVFAPSSTKIDATAILVVEKIATAMEGCDEVPMEIGGHTDSQGRETMNQTLSQARAESVLDALLRLEVLTTFLSAKGYGEAQPIADNGTEEGRAANRRIEFKLVDPENGQAVDPETAPEPPEETDE